MFYFYRPRTPFLYILALFFVTLLLQPAYAQETGTADQGRKLTYVIQDIDVEKDGDAFFLRVKGDRPPTYTMYELFDPLRIVLDIAGASFEKSVDLPMDIKDGPVSRITGKVVDNREPFSARVEIFLAEDQEYSVEREKNDIKVVFAQAQESKEEQVAVAGQATEIYAIEVDATETGTNVYLRTDGPVRDYKYNSIAAGSGRPDRIYVDLKNVADRGDLAPLTHVGTVLEKIRVSQRSGGIRIVLDSGLDELFEYNISEQPDGLLITIEEPAVVEEIIAGVIAGLAPEEEKPVPSVINTKKKKKVKLTEPLQEEFGETGYSNKRFSVNFYKIDLHNVFRIIGEFTGKNIVVAEDVGGFLTLQLDDVPWDFALDIIMNLKGLQKNEQFNTIVISKSGAFVWPKMITEYLSFKKYMPEQEIDPDVIEGMHEQKEARDMISRARAMIENKTFAQALPLLEAAYERWPENAQLANQIASLCLVNLGMNLKAVHYAKFALAMDSEDSNAALMAAIASANMEKADEAKDFFSMAVASDEPSREALTSYAAFLEINEDFVRALNLLERYEELFGDTMDTIIARARIYDKTGKADKAVAEYRTALLSGYEIPTDLKRYIQERVAVAKQK